MSSREAMLAAIGAAIGGPHDPVQVPRAYQRRAELAPGSPEAVALLTERLVDYRAEVITAQPGTVAEAVGAALAPSRSVVVPAGLPGDLTARLARTGLRVVTDGEPEPLAATALDEIDAVVTTATVAVAVNGTIVLDGGPGQGRRVISLIPDLHVIVLSRRQVVGTMPEALALLTPQRPITMIAGPSATSDIELSRVEGVHGPRTLRVVIVDDVSE
jgi:L-lactate dehydrogenase complex protein LldG